MAGYYDKRQRTMSWIYIIAIVVVMLATFYGPDLLFPSINGTEQNILWFNFITKYLVLFVAVLAVTGFYIYGVVDKVRRKKLPKNFWSVGHIILKVLAALGVILVVLFTVTSFVALNGDLSEGAQYENIDVCNVTTVGTTTYFNENDGTNPENPKMFTCQQMNGVEMRTGNTYKFAYYANTKTYIAVEHIGETPAK